MRAGTHLRSRPLQLDDDLDSLRYRGGRATGVGSAERAGDAERRNQR